MSQSRKCVLPEISGSLQDVLNKPRSKFKSKFKLCRIQYTKSEVIVDEVAVLGPHYRRVHEFQVGLTTFMQRIFFYLVDVISCNYLKGPDGFVGHPRLKMPFGHSVFCSKPLESRPGRECASRGCSCNWPDTHEQRTQ